MFWPLYDVLLAFPKRKKKKNGMKFACVYSRLKFCRHKKWSWSSHVCGTCLTPGTHPALRFFRQMLPTRQKHYPIFCMQTQHTQCKYVMCVPGRSVSLASNNRCGHSIYTSSMSFTRSSEWKLNFAFWNPLLEKTWGQGCQIYCICMIILTPARCTINV